VAIPPPRCFYRHLIQAAQGLHQDFVGAGRAESDATLDQGTIYPALLRLEQQGWNWARTAAMMTRMLEEQS
jgi:hypothetical protein